MPINYFFFGVGYKECGVFNVGRIFFLLVTTASEITVFLTRFFGERGAGATEGRPHFPRATARPSTRPIHATDSTMMTSRRGSIVATIFLFSILLSTVPQDACAFGGFSGGWGGGSSSNRLTISGPGYSRTVGKDGSVKQSFEQTTTGKR